MKLAVMLLACVIARPALAHVTPEPVPDVPLEKTSEDAAGVALEEPPPHRPTFGPTLSLQIPHPIWVDFEKRLNPDWSLALGLGGFGITRRNQPNREFNLSLTAIDLRGRWHPWGGSFFLGTALGVQTLKGSASTPISFTVNSTPYTINTTVEAKVTTLYATPHLGWLWQFATGFVMGLDFGVQLPLTSSTSLNVGTDNGIANALIAVIETTQEYKELNRQVENAGNQLGQTTLPYFTALRIGWFFDVEAD